MTLPHEQTALRLVQNLNVVRRMYERGWFEHSAIVDVDGVLKMPPTDPTLFAGPQPQLDPALEWCKLEDAASKLNLQARELLLHLKQLKAFADTDLYIEETRKLWRGLSGYQSLLKAVYRAQIIHYELKDAFLRASGDEERTFRGYSERIARGVKGERDYQKVGKNIGEMFEEDTGIEWDSDLWSCVTDEFLLLGLSGINAYYRQHSSESYSEGLALLLPLELYIRKKHERTKNRPSWGLLGLAAYMRGRFQFGLGLYTEARNAWIESCDCQARKIEQKRTNLADVQKRAKWEDTRSLCLRRSALASAMGNGYLLLVTSKLNACLEVVVLSRAVLTKSCGAVYAAYVDLIYAAAKRAKYGSDLKVLEECELVLERCRATFKDLVTQSHYVERANVELALVFHHKAKALAGQSHNNSRTKSKIADEIKDLYKRAKENLDSAIDYADGKKTHPPKRNPRMLAEAYALRSHLWRHQPQNDREYATRPGWLEALKDAQNALKNVGKMAQLECEARVAFGVAYIALAEGLKSKVITLRYRDLAERQGVPMPDRGVQANAGNGRGNARHRESNPDPRDGQVRREILIIKREADKQLCKALEVNATANPRISAICFLRLAQSALLMETTLPDAWFYFWQYKAIADQVEHAFCHEHAARIESELQQRGQFFVVDLRNGDFHLETWKEKLEDHIYSETINWIVKERLSIRPPSHETTSPVKNQRRGRKPTDESSLIRELVKYTGVSEGTARPIAKKRLDDFRTKLKALGEDVDDGENAADNSGKDES